MRRQQGVVDQAHDLDTPPYYPMGVLNGYLTAAPNIHAPTTTQDHSPVEFRRYVNASGAQDVQIWNGLQRRTGSGLRIPFISYLYASVPQIPGQMRDNYGGFHKHGIDPGSYNRAWQNGPGSQSQTAGGVRQMSGDYLQNPGTS
jgi:hypothetical protein